MHTISAPELPWLPKLQFIRHGVWLRSRPAGSYNLRFKEGEIVLSYANNETDRNVVWVVFVNCCYGNDFHDSTVIDIGAHKGYFGAYGLMHGAKRVFSYEPECENFEFLNQTARSFRSRGHDWETRRAAVAASNGEVELRVDPNSWAHSIASLGPSSLTPREDIQVVDGTAMTEVVSSAAESSGGDRLIVKIDAEGAECAIILQTPIESWQRVDEVFVEVHDFAACTSTELVDHLVRAGLGLVDVRFGVLHLTRSPRG